MNATLPCLALVLLLQGCAGPRARLPVPLDAPPQAQPEWLAVQHWQLGAARQAAEIAQALQQAGLAGRPLAVAAAQPDSPLARAWQGLLQTELHRAGLRVQPEATLQVQTEIQLFGFAPGRANQGPVAAPDDLLNRPIPQHEALLHTRLREGSGPWLLHRSQAVYLRDEDLALYRAAPGVAPARTVPVLAR
ncbi:hypothetical protein [Aquariibacter albus]|uniref:Uncharacterized protein n=1 Tax=Aquariibacter albus TaxID=2759899 RepID=A0A839HME1_9BURK|nr:hypothetical protein [Aquariibacter albus]MBB1160419.1 hypothetical protein [Aquariibacter albus]